MDRHATRSVDIPKWSALLVEAVNKPGLIMKAYTSFHSYSLGNQVLALVQCQMRGLEPGPINTFPKWKGLGRTVKRGERALILCMPITRKRRDEETDESDELNGEHTFTSFMHKARWFVISQTIGEEFTPPVIPQWDTAPALAALDIELINFTDPDGNCQGFATRKRQIAINPVAQLPLKTLLHEAGHIVLGHTSEGDFTSSTPKLALPVAWRSRRRNPRKECAENLSRGRSNPAGGRLPRPVGKPGSTGCGGMISGPPSALAWERPGSA